MSLASIRQHLDALPLLSYEAFQTTDGVNLLVSFDEKDLPQVMKPRQETQGLYLHYMCYMGRFAPLRYYLETLKAEHDPTTFHAILNHTGFYEHYDGTPLHTLASWNNSPKLARYLVQQGADPNLLDYYQERPGREGGESFCIPGFTVGCEVDDYSNSPDTCQYVLRKDEDFAEIYAYLDSLQAGPT